MNASVILGIFSGLVHLTAYVIYNRELLAGRSRPNIATWSLWTFLAALNTATYLAASGDWVKAFTPTVGFLACAITLILLVHCGCWTRLNFLDLIVLVIGIGAGLFWLVEKDAMRANLLLQAAFVLSNIPTLRNVWKDPSVERALPWFGFGLAYVLNLVVILMRWQHQFSDLAYPVISLVADGGIGLTVVWRRSWLARHGRRLA